MMIRVILVVATPSKSQFLTFNKHLPDIEVDDNKYRSFEKVANELRSYYLKNGDWVQPKLLTVYEQPGLIHIAYGMMLPDAIETNHGAEWMKLPELIQEQHLNRIDIQIIQDACGRL